MAAAHPPEVTTWRAILDDELQSMAAEALEGITRDLQRLEPADVRFKPDLALYFAYLARAKKEKAYEERALEWLDAVMDDIESSQIGIGLYGGIAGAAWVIEHVNRMFTAAPERMDDDTDPLNEVDSLLVNLAQHWPWQRPYDLIGGVVGVGVYFLERLPRPLAREGLEQVVSHLEKTAERSDSGFSWHTPVEQLPEWQRRLAPRGYYNLGMAHGIPGIIALAAHCLSLDIAASHSQTVLSGAMNWLLVNQHPHHGSRFESWITPESPQPRGSGLSWCYGDLGVAVAMLSAGLAGRERSWTVAAIETMTECATRSSSTSGGRDAGLCHGAAGLAHIYNRAFHVTGEEPFLKAAREWLAQTLQRRTGRGYGGYQSYSPTGLDGRPIQPPWRDDASFLTGSVGTGLALLAGLTDTPPTWDRLLLTTPPSVEARVLRSSRE